MFKFDKVIGPTKYSVAMHSSLFFSEEDPDTANKAVKLAVATGLAEW